MSTLPPLLIAEDEKNDVFFLTRAMQKSGIPNPIFVVEDGQQLMDYLAGTGSYSDRASFPLPSLLLLDLKLPCVNGNDVLKWIRHESSVPSLLVVVLSSSTVESDIRNAYENGANSYVVKPADPHH